MEWTRVSPAHHGFVRIDCVFQGFTEFDRILHSVDPNSNFYQTSQDIPVFKVFPITLFTVFLSALLGCNRFYWNCRVGQGIFQVLLVLNGIYWVLLILLWFSSR